MFRLPLRDLSVHPRFHDVATSFSADLELLKPLGARLPLLEAQNTTAKNVYTCTNEYMYLHVHEQPHLLMYNTFFLWFRLNEICQNLEDHIEDS